VAGRIRSERGARCGCFGEGEGFFSDWIDLLVEGEGEGEEEGEG
jgi:hypothetical protein